MRILKSFIPWAVALVSSLPLLGAPAADERAQQLLSALTLDEKLALLHGPMALPLFGPNAHLPPDAIPAAGYIPGVPRLGIPPLLESDASLGIVNPLGLRPGDVATALPSSLALAASFDPSFAYRAGAMLGAEARAKGFDVLLGGGMNLARDPRNGRNFEYLGEDPLLAGMLAGEQVRGTQDQHVISTVKHFALNANETNRMTLDARIDKAAARESDLLAFELALERGHPGSVMCSYNKVNGTYACGNGWLLNDVLKRDWHFSGWVMSDWGAAHAAEDALQGLDQESGEQLDKEIWFGAPLQQALAHGSVPRARIDDMVRRILRSMIAVGVLDDPPRKAAIDYRKDAAVALEEERRGLVLLKNEAGLLPLAPSLRRIAVIGGFAHVGVLSGGGSSQATPSNGEVLRIPVGGRGLMSIMRNAVYFPSPPLKYIQAAAPKADVVFDSGNFPADAASVAAHSDVAIVFATQHQMEGYDVPDMRLPNGQDELISAVAAANPHTIVVLEIGNPVSMPWLANVAGVMVAWYPGQEGGRAIADVLFGSVNPSGHLPMTFPIDDAHSVRPVLPNLGAEPDAPVTVDYTEGADVGYRWYAAHAVRPQFWFGHGLSYSTFSYQHLEVKGGRTLRVSFEVRNMSSRDGEDVPQVYLTSAAGQPVLRLVGFKRVAVKAGEIVTVEAEVDARLLGHFNETQRRWRIPAGDYAVGVGASAGDLVLHGQAAIAASTLE